MRGLLKIIQTLQNGIHSLLPGFPDNENRNRKDGDSMEKTIYLGQEATVLENDALRVIVMPQRGGKIASVVHKASGFEALHQPAAYPALVPGMPFDQGDASGFDDVFPSMGEAEMPDHGEIWTSAMQPETEGGALRLHCDGQGRPYTYTKWVELQDAAVICRYEIVNASQQELPCVWVCHCLMRLEDGMRFVFPPECSVAENVMSGSVLGTAGTMHPVNGLKMPPPDGTAAKFYMADSVKTGVCSAVYPQSGRTVTMRYDAQALPYLGFWITNGGYRGERNFAFEPATGYYDTVDCARARGRLKTLAPGEKLSFSLMLEIE